MQHVAPDEFLSARPVQRPSARTHFTGLAAEEAAACAYERAGGRVRASRYRVPEGEIDLVVEMPDGLVFVEVKARRSVEDAASSVSPRQWARIGAAATRYLAEHTDGTLPCRFDLALLDRSGRLERIENAASFDGW